MTTPARPPNIAVRPGDGIGSEVLDQGLRVLHAVAPDVTYEHFDFGAERYLRDGTTLPDAALDRFRNEFDCIYLGALGDPRVPSNVHAKDILLGSSDYEDTQMWLWRQSSPGQFEDVSEATGMNQPWPAGLAVAKRVLFSVALRASLAVDAAAFRIG